MFLREAYEIYSQSSDHTKKVKFSKFCELRPRNVLLMKDSLKDQFKCIIHENFMNMLMGYLLHMTQANYDIWFFVIAS